MDTGDITMDSQMTAVDEKAQQDLGRIGTADILIGIPSYNNADSIGRVIKAADLGLAKYFPDKKCVILVSEGGGLEDTQLTIDSLSGKHYFENTFIPRPEFGTEVIATKYIGTSGKGTAIKAIFEAASSLNVKAGCMLDSDLKSISPEWIQLLLTPVMKKDFGFVTPYYSRHKYDGTITNMIAYPVTMALYGRRVRQPIGGDFGFSLELINSLLSKDVWETDIARFGIDIWMTTVAICEGFKICQSFMGAKIHDDKDPGNDLSPMFVQVVGTIFRLMAIYYDQWVEVKGSRPTAIFGFESEVAPKPLTVNADNMINKFKEALPEYLAVWEKVLEKENCRKIQEVAKMGNSHFELPTELWVKSLFDFACAFKSLPEGLTEVEIIDALVPVYYARTASFVINTNNLDTHQAEEIINQQCESFENLKPYLLDRWSLNGGSIS